MKTNHNSLNFEEFAKTHPEFFERKPKDNFDKMKFLCQCTKGHMFDYRERTLYPPDDRHHAPCQGKCPICGNTQFYFVSQSIYPIKWNFVG